MHTPSFRSMVAAVLAMWMLAGDALTTFASLGQSGGTATEQQRLLEQVDAANHRESNAIALTILSRGASIGSILKRLESLEQNIITEVKSIDAEAARHHEICDKLSRRRISARLDTSDSGTDDELISTGDMTGPTGTVGTHESKVKSDATGTIESIAKASAKLQDAEAVKTDAVHAAEVAEAAVHSAKSIAELNEAKQKARKAEEAAEMAGSIFRRAKLGLKNATLENEKHEAASGGRVSSGINSWKYLAQKVVGCATRPDNNFTTHNGLLSTTSVQKDGIMPRYLDWLEHCEVAPRSNSSSASCLRAKREIEAWENDHHQTCANMLRHWIDSQGIAVPRVSMTEQERKHEKSGELATAHKLEGSKVCNAYTEGKKGKTPCTHA